MQWASATWRWKVGLAAFSIAVVLLNAWAQSRAAVLYVQESQGALGVTFNGSERGWLELGVVAPASPLGMAGLKGGDRVRFDRAGDVHRLLEVDEPIGLLVRDAAGSTRHLTVRAASEPMRPRDILLAVITSSGTWLMLAMGLLIGWRGADSVPLRALAASLLSQTFHMAADVLPGGALQSFLATTLPVATFTVAYVSLVYFALAYAQWPLFGERRGWLIYRIYLAVFMADSFAVLAKRSLPDSALAALSLNGTGIALALFSSAFAFLVLAFGWRRAQGLRRERLAWVVVCLGAIDAAYFTENLAAAFSQSESVSLVADLAAGILVSAGNAGLAYAVLRHRVLDFGFAVNRAVVYGTTSVLLAALFMLASQLLNGLLHFDAREDHRILDLAIGLGLALTSRQAVRWVDPRVQRIFFRRWHAAAEKLAAFRIDTIHGKDPRALRVDFLEAVREFSGVATAGFYLAAPSGGLRLSENVGGGLCAEIAAGGPLMQALETSKGAVEVRRADSAMDAVLALPMRARGRLVGAVLVGPKPDEEPFRPDERKQLAHTAQHVGLELELARLGALEAKGAAPRGATPRKKKGRTARAR